MDLGDRAQFCQQGECVFWESHRFAKTSLAKKKRHTLQGKEFGCRKGLAQEFSGKNPTQPATNRPTMEPQNSACIGGDE